MLPLIFPALALGAAQPRLVYPTRPHIIRPTEHDRRAAKTLLAGIGPIAAARRRGGGGGSLPGVMDAYTANLWAACGLERLIANFSVCVQAENTPTAAVTNIGFDGAGDLDSTALLAHAPVSGTAKSFLDQSALNNYFGNGNSSRTPAIVSGSAYLGLLRFDGTDDNYRSLLNLGASVSGMTVFMRGRLRSTATAQIIVELSPNYTTNDAFTVYYDNAISRIVVGSHRNTGAQYAISEFNVSATTEAVWCFRVDRTQVLGANQCVMFVNGTKQTRTGATGETATRPSGDFGTHFLFVASRNNSSVYANLDMKNLVAYTAALSDADVAAISALL